MDKFYELRELDTTDEVQISSLLSPSSFCRARDRRNFDELSELLSMTKEDYYCALRYFMTKDEFLETLNKLES